MIEFENVHIAYGKNHVIRGISFRVEKGEIFGIIGPNGAGKTTLLRALVGMIIPDRGRVLLRGKEVHKTKAEERKIAYLFEVARAGSFLRLTPEEDLEFYAALYNVDVDRERIREVLKLVRLYNERKKKLYTFSRGMWQKLYLARVILPDFPVIVLDEPWLGLDVAAQKETVNMLHRFRDMGKTIILSAHEMPLIERSCTRIMLLKEGEKVVEGPPGKLFDSVGWRYRVIIKYEQEEKIVYVKDLREIVPYIQNSEIYKVDIEPISLEDVYLHLVGERND